MTSTSGNPAASLRARSGKPRTANHAIVQTSATRAFRNNRRQQQYSWADSASPWVWGFDFLGFLLDPWVSNAEIHRVSGEPARVVGARPDSGGLRIVTWNIERGLAYASVLEVLRKLDADVLLLQEVDRDCRRTEYRHVAKDLAHALNMNWVAAGEFQELGEARGKAPAIGTQRPR